MSFRWELISAYPIRLAWNNDKWIDIIDEHVRAWEFIQYDRFNKLLKLRRKRDDRRIRRRCMRVQKLMDGLLLRWIYHRAREDWENADAVRKRMLKHGVRPVKDVVCYRWTIDDKHMHCKTLRRIPACVLGYWSSTRNVLRMKQ